MEISDYQQSDASNKNVPMNYCPTTLEKLVESLVGKVKSVKTEKIEFEHWDEPISVASLGHLKLWRLPYIEETTVFKNKFCPKIIAIENSTEEVNGDVTENGDIENR